MGVRAYEGADLRAVADLYQRAVPTSTLGRLGPDAVARFLDHQLRLDGVEGFVVGPPGRPIGALVGGRFGRGTSEFVRAHAGFLALQVVRHPTVLAHAGAVVAVRVGAGSLLRPRRGPERPDRVPAGSYGVLVLAVDPDHQGRGLGRALLEAAEGSARTQGFRALHLTVNPTLDASLRFYQGQGLHRLDPPGDAPRAWLMGKDLQL